MNHLVSSFSLNQGKILYIYATKTVYHRRFSFVLSGIHF
jgi:hypothetical protein